MEWNHCGYLGFQIYTILAHLGPEVILLLQRKFRLNTTKCRKLIFKMAAVVAILEFFNGSFSNFVSTRGPNAHHQVSIQLDSRGDVQNMNSYHFSHINI